MTAQAVKNKVIIRIIVLRSDHFRIILIITGGDMDSPEKSVEVAAEKATRERGSTIEFPVITAWTMRLP